MTRRARLPAVLGTLLAGAVGVISSTQTWLLATLDDAGRQQLAVPGAAAVPVLAPLSLATLALGAALSIVGLVLRYVFGVLTVAVAAVLGFLSAQVASAPPVSAVASTVTASTGITGTDAVDALVTTIAATPWPAVTIAAAVVLSAAGVVVLATAARWGRTGRRYDPDAATSAPEGGGAASRPHDAIDSWDDLSRGTDPTADPTAGPR